MKTFKFIFTILFAIAVASATSCEQPEEPGTPDTPGTDEPVIVPASDIRIEAEQNSIVIGGTTTLTVTVLPEDATDKEYKLSIDEEGKSIISIEDNVVTGLAEGTATITATLGDLQASCEITVTTEVILATEIKIAPEKDVIALGEITNVIVTILPENTTDKNYKLTVNEEGQSVVSLFGYEVMGLSEGTATITATLGDLQASCEITVISIKATEIKIEASSETISIGKVATLNVTILPEDATDKVYTLTVNEEGQSVVRLDGNMVMGLAEGTAIITATIGDLQDACEITVIESDEEIVTLDIEKVLVRAARKTFAMGSPETEEGRFSDEVLHNVTFTQDYYISTYEITNDQYAQFLNANNISSTHKFTDGKITYTYLTQNQDFGVYYSDSEAKWLPAAGKENYPVIYVTHYGAKAFAAWVGGSLPTEAQWEFACRAGTQTAYYFGDNASMLDEYAVYSGNAEGEHASEIGSKQPNAWGIYDMHGNANEWCLDTWDAYTPYGPEDVVDPVSPNPGPYNVVRGGSWYDPAAYCRSAVRIVGQADYATSDIGFRVVFPVE